MPIHQKNTTEDRIDLDEFISLANQSDIGSVDGLLSLAEPFTKLANNRSFLSEFFAAFIKQNVVFDSLATVISQSVVLGRGKDFYIRANFWLPEKDMTTNEAQLFAYHQAHDHNFDLLTVAYCGDGYLTDGYQYEYDAVAGYIGEIVDIEPLGRIKHQCGEILLYICNKDIHIQRPPEYPSVTLNVIPTVNQNGLRDQYFFDIDGEDSRKGKIYAHATTVIEQRRNLFEIAKYVADKELVNIFVDFAHCHPCGRTRYEALKALQACNVGVHDQLCWELRNEKTPILEMYVRSVLVGQHS